MVLEDLATAHVVRRTTARFMPSVRHARTPQTRRPERQRSREPLVELFLAERIQFGGGLRIGVVSDPLLRGR